MNFFGTVEAWFKRAYFIHYTVIIVYILTQTHGPYHKGNRITQGHKNG